MPDSTTQNLAFQYYAKAIAMDTLDADQAKICYCRHWIWRNKLKNKQAAASYFRGDV